MILSLRITLQRRTRKIIIALTKRRKQIVISTITNSEGKQI